MVLILNCVYFQPRHNFTTMFDLKLDKSNSENELITLRGKKFHNRFFNKTCIIYAHMASTTILEPLI
jgi:hypothetical protein